MLLVEGISITKFLRLTSEQHWIGLKIAINPCKFCPRLVMQYTVNSGDLSRTSVDSCSRRCREHGSSRLTFQVDCVLQGECSQPVLLRLTHPVHLCYILQYLCVDPVVEHLHQTFCRNVFELVYTAMTKVVGLHPNNPSKLSYCKAILQQCGRVFIDVAQTIN